MANLPAIVREYTLRARSEGVEKVAADAQRLGQSTDAVAVATEKTSRATLSAERAYERVRRQLDETYRAQQRYTQQTEAIQRAVDQGLIRSTNEWIGLQGRARAQLEATTRTNDNFGKSAGVAASRTAGLSTANQNLIGSTTNLAAQFQDIAVQLQSGQNPMTIALQQGTQISAALGDRGAAGSVKALGAAFMSIISPVSLVTIGTIALGGALFSYVTSAGSEVESLDDKLKRHADLINSVKEAYGEVAKGIEDIGRASGNVLATQLRANISMLEADLVGLSRKITSAALTVMPSIGSLETGVSGGAEQVDIDKKYSAFASALRSFHDEIERGSPNIRGLINNIAAIAATDQANAQLQRLAAELIASAGAAGQIEIAIEKALRAINAMGGAASGSASQIKGFSDAMESLSKIALPAIDSDKILASVNLDKALSAASGLDDVNVALNAHAQALTRIKKVEDERAARSGSRVDNDRLRSLRDVAEYSMRLGDATASVRIAQLELQKAQERGIITEGQYGELIAETTRRLQEQAAQNKIRREGIEGQLAFEREQIFRTQTEQRVASTLRSNGVDADSERGKAIASQVRLNDALEETKKIASDAMGGFVKDLLAGVKAAEALNNVMKRIGETLTTKGIEAAISGALTGNPVQAGVGAAAAAVGIGMQMFGAGGDSPARQRRLQMIEELQRQEDDERLRLEEERVQAAADLNQKIADNTNRIRAAQGRLFAASNDNSTLGGALAAFERDAQRDREAEALAGGAAMADLEAAFAAERLGIIKDFEAKAREAEAAIAARRLSFEDRLFASSNDASTIAGALAAFDRASQREREDELRTGGEAINELVAAQEAARFNIIRDFGDRAIEEQRRVVEEAATFISGVTRRIREYVDGLRAGSASPLAPLDRLNAAQTQYNAQRTLAQSGNRDALGGITSYASDYLDAARAYYGSAAGFQSIFNTTTSQLEALPSQVSPEQFIVDAINLSRTELKTALASNSPGLIATALNAHFDGLDANVNGLLDFAELKLGLQQVGVAVESGRLSQIFSTLDSDGDGQISRLELIKNATQSTDIRTATSNTQLGNVSSNTGNTVSKVSDSVGQLDQIKNIDSDSRSLLDQMRSLNVTQNSLLDLMRVALTGSVRVGESGLTVDNTMVEALNKIVLNTAFNNNKIGAAFAVAQGGWIDGAGTSTSDSNMAFLSRGEYVIRASEAAKWGGLLEDINAGRGLTLPSMPVPFAANANGPSYGELIAEVKALRSELSALRRDNNAVTLGAAEMQVAGTREALAPLSRNGRLAAARAA